MKKQSMYQQILTDLINGVCTYGNYNTGFFINNGEMYMCEYHKDCKYTRYYSIQKLARRINKFLKTGY